VPVTCNHYSLGGGAYCDPNATCVACKNDPQFKRPAYLNCDGINENGCETYVVDKGFQCPPKKP
jgi:hypothetical protein